MSGSGEISGWGEGVGETGRPEGRGDRKLEVEWGRRLGAQEAGGGMGG